MNAEDPTATAKYFILREVYPQLKAAAVQAFEDTTTIAAVLDIIGKGNVQLAFGVFEKLR